MKTNQQKFRFVNPWLVFVVTHMIKDHALSCPILWLSLTQSSISTTSWRKKKKKKKKTPSGYRIRGPSFLTRSSPAHNSILTSLLCVFPPLLRCFLPQFLSVLSFIPFLLEHYYNLCACWKSVIHSVHCLRLEETGILFLFRDQT